MESKFLDICSPSRAPRLNLTSSVSSSWFNENSRNTRGILQYGTLQKLFHTLHIMMTSSITLRVFWRTQPMVGTWFPFVNRGKGHVVLFKWEQIISLRRSHVLTIFCCLLWLILPEEALPTDHTCLGTKMCHVFNLGDFVAGYQASASVLDVMWLSDHFCTNCTFQKIEWCAEANISQHANVVRYKRLLLLLKKNILNKCTSYS